MIDKQWHKYPDERPPQDGEYLVVVASDLGKLMYRVYEYKDFNWIGSRKNNVIKWTFC